MSWCCAFVYVHQSCRWCGSSVTMLIETPSASIPVFSFTLKSSLCLFFPLVTFVTLVLSLIKLHQKKIATLCFESILICHKPAMTPFVSVPSMQSLPSPLFQADFTCLPCSGLFRQMVSKHVHKHVCNTNSMHHTVKMAMLFSLRLRQLKANTGTASVRPSVWVTQHTIGTQWGRTIFFSHSLFSINHSFLTPYDEVPIDNYCIKKYDSTQLSFLWPCV